MYSSLPLKQVTPPLFLLARLLLSLSTMKLPTVVCCLVREDALAFWVGLRPTGYGSYGNSDVLAREEASSKGGLKKERNHLCERRAQ